MGLKIVLCLSLDFVVDTKMAMTDEKVSGDRLALVTNVIAIF